VCVCVCELISDVWSPVSDQTAEWIRIRATSGY
jgi:hypothetical protein